MKPQVQSRIGKDGRCFPACIASILELPEASVPDLDNTNETQVNDFLKQYGQRYQEIPIDADTPIPVGYHIICGVSPRGGMHAVVGRDGEFIHDPHPVEDDPRRGVVKPLRWGLLTPTKNRMSKLYDRRPNLRAKDVHPFDYQWGPKDALNLRAIIGNLEATVRMIESDAPIAPARQAEANGYRREIIGWERLLAKCGAMERRGARDAKGERIKCPVCGTTRYTDKPGIVPPHVTFNGARCPGSGSKGAAEDRADMMALHRNTAKQGGPFRIQLTEKNGREHTESAHALRAYDANGDPLALDFIIRRESRAPTGDQRRRVNVVTAGYKGSDGYEYRKSFESYEEPMMPQSGTHKQLNALREQWRKQGAK